MTRYLFQEGIPEGLAFDFDSGIFHDPRHLQLQSLTGWQSYAMLNDEKRSIVALLHVYIENEIAVSPLRSTYGSILFSKELTSEVLTEFVTYIESKVKAKGIKKLMLKNSPEVYATDESELLRKILESSGYEGKPEISAVLRVTKSPFESRLHYSERKKLRKCKDSGLTFQELSLQDLHIVYQFLKTCREEKGYSLSMSFEEIRKMIDIFPEFFFLTSVTHNDQLVAANISIQVNSRVLYNFYHDHKASYDVLSPVVFLNEGLYQICQLRKLELLDLGTSQAGGKLNESLLKFKLKLGAQPSNKYTFFKNLS